MFAKPQAFFKRITSREQVLQLKMDAKSSQSRSLSVDFVDNTQQIKHLQNEQFTKYDDLQLHLKTSQKMMIIQTEISDFIVVELNEAGKSYQILSIKDWQKIIKQQSTAGYNMIDIHVSLLISNLDFIERRFFWLLICDVKQTSDKLRNQEHRYSEFTYKQTPFKSLIEKDVKRTMIGDNFFISDENQKSLTNLLVAYANYDPELGYTQGMNFIVANLLICYDLSQNDSNLDDVEVIDVERDENLFYILIHILVEKNWRSIFMDGMPGLIKLLKVLEYRFMKEIPDLYVHFIQSGLDMYICFSDYYMSLMMKGIPWKFARTILDLFLFEGEQILHSFILAMLKLYKDRLLHMQMQEIVRYCKDQMIVDFYELYKMQHFGERDLTNTLTRLGLIQIQTQQFSQEPPIQEPPKQEQPKQELMETKKEEQQLKPATKIRQSPFKKPQNIGIALKKFFTKQS